MILIIAFATLIRHNSLSVTTTQSVRNEERWKLNPPSICIPPRADRNDSHRIARIAIRTSRCHSNALAIDGYFPPQRFSHPGWPFHQRQTSKSAFLQPRFVFAIEIGPVESQLPCRRCVYQVGRILGAQFRAFAQDGGELFSRAQRLFRVHAEREPNPISQFQVFAKNSLGY